MFAVEFDFAAMANAGPVKLALIQAPSGKPDLSPARVCSMSKYCKCVCTWIIELSAS